MSEWVTELTGRAEDVGARVPPPEEIAMVTTMFPNARHDDQVDALAQLLDWVRRQWVHVPAANCGPMLVTFHDDGGIEVSGEDYGLFEPSWFPRKPFDPWGCA